MRIITGKYGGKEIASPHSKRTRPMSEKLRNALFNTLGDISGQSLLDAFAGSGAVGLEAVSRGAAEVTLIDNDRSSQRVIAENIKHLGVGHKAKLISASSGAWLETSNDTFDIVICDPPYDKIPFNLLEELAGRVKPKGIVVFSFPKTLTMSLPNGYVLLSEKLYGDAKLIYFRSD